MRGRVNGIARPRSHQVPPERYRFAFARLFIGRRDGNLGDELAGYRIRRDPIRGGWGESIRWRSSQANGNEQPPRHDKEVQKMWSFTSVNVLRRIALFAALGCLGLTAVLASSAVAGGEAKVVVVAGNTPWG